jgi:hypothetical protein
LILDNTSFNFGGLSMGNTPLNVCCRLLVHHTLLNLGCRLLVHHTSLNLGCRLLVYNATLGWLFIDHLGLLIYNASLSGLFIDHLGLLIYNTSLNLFTNNAGLFDGSILTWLTFDIGGCNNGFFFNVATLETFSFVRGVYWLDNFYFRSLSLDLNQRLVVHLRGRC